MRSSQRADFCEENHRKNFCRRLVGTAALKVDTGLEAVGNASFAQRQSGDNLMQPALLTAVWNYDCQDKRYIRGKHCISGRAY
jgi:hypothetical protein